MCGLSAGSCLVSQDDPVFGQANASPLTPAFLLSRGSGSEDSHPPVVSAYPMSENSQSSCPPFDANFRYRHLGFVSNYALGGMQDAISSVLLPPAH